jgi:hypothetical protein
VNLPQLSWRCVLTGPGCVAALQLYAEAEKRQKMAKRKDYYKILAVDQSASSRDIKSVRGLQAYLPVAQLFVCAWGCACSVLMQQDVCRMLNLLHRVKGFV